MNQSSPSVAQDQNRGAETTVMTNSSPTSASSSSRPQTRDHHRVPIDLDVDLGSDGTHQGFLENMSCGGIFVATHLVKPVGSSIEFCIHMPDGLDAVRGVGEVRWVREPDEWGNVPPGIGILFVRLDRGCEHTIKRFVAHLQSVFFDHK